MDKLAAAADRLIADPWSAMALPPNPNRDGRNSTRPHQARPR